MKLRFYLRGLGIGIVVTALLMGFTLSTRNNTVSDEEIKKRAEELGMVEESRLLVKEDPGKDSAEEKSEDKAGEKTQEQEQDKASEQKSDVSGDEKNADAASKDTTDTGDANADKEKEASDSSPEKPELKDNSNMELNVSGTVSADDDSVSEADPKDEASVSDKGSEKTSGEGSVTITVGSGDGSYDVCRKLEELGIIDDAGDFDSYLMTNRLDSYLLTGSHDIPEGAGYEEIVKLLTGR